MFPGIAFHWTVQHYKGMIYGGLHETTTGALRAKEALVKEAQADVSNVRASWPENRHKEERIKELEAYVQSWLSSHITFLQEKNTYIPWGVGGVTLTHGVNDGLHHAEFRPVDERISETLQPSVLVV